MNRSWNKDKVFKERRKEEGIKSIWEKEQKLKTATKTKYMDNRRPLEANQARQKMNTNEYNPRKLAWN